MSATSFAQQPISNRLSRQASRSSIQDSQVAIKVSVNANRQRIFQALTLPEYVEAWIAPPEDASQQRAVSTTPEGFRIEVPDSLGPESSISGSYLTLRRSKLIFTWQKGWSPDAPMSTVTIRLNGDFDRTEIILTHAGLNSRRECEWHRTFWHESIRRLSNLFLSSRQFGNKEFTRSPRAK